MIRTKVRHALDEARMLVLGVQVLLGFEMRACFESRFDALPPAERWLKLAGFSVLLGVLGLLLAPAARHRLVERGRDTAAFHRFVQGCMELALLPFALVMGLEFSLAAARMAGPVPTLATGAAAPPAPPGGRRKPRRDPALVRHPAAAAEAPSARGGNDGRSRRGNPLGRSHRAGPDRGAGGLARRAGVARLPVRYLLDAGPRQAAAALSRRALRAPRLRRG